MEAFRNPPRHSLRPVLPREVKHTKILQKVFHSAIVYQGAAITKIARHELQRRAKTTIILHEEKTTQRQPESSTNPDWKCGSKECRGFC